VPDVFRPRPAHHDEEHVQGEQDDGDVVEEGRHPGLRHELIRSPEHECGRQQRCLQKLSRTGLPQTLVGQVGEGDQYERQRRQQALDIGRKRCGKSIPGQERPYGDHQDHAQAGLGHPPEAGFRGIG